MLVVEDVVCTVEPLLGTAVTVYAVTGAPLAGTTGGVHVTVMDEPEVAMAVTPPGGGGTALVQREKQVKVREPFAHYWIDIIIMQKQTCKINCARGSIGHPHTVSGNNFNRVTLSFHKLQTSKDCVLRCGGLGLLHGSTSLQSYLIPNYGSPTIV